MTTLLARYEEYREALQLLGADHTTVASRKVAIHTRDAFEKDVRMGLLDSIFFSKSLMDSTTEWQCDDCLGWSKLTELRCHRCGRNKAVRS